MLIQFTLGNYRTFKEKATLSLLASNYDKKTRAAENLIEDNKFNLRLLKSAVIYGANASGKSKLLEGLWFMTEMMVNSFKGTTIGQKINVLPFRLSSETEEKPSFLEIYILLNDGLYRYGFEAATEGIKKEWLFQRDLKKEILIFERGEGSNHFHPFRFKTGKVLEKGSFIRNNALLLSTAAQFNDKICSQIVEYIRDYRFITSPAAPALDDYTKSSLANPVMKTKILEFLQAADIGIKDIYLAENNIYASRLNREAYLTTSGLVSEPYPALFSDIKTIHRRFNKKKMQSGQVEFSLDRDESEGTRRFLQIAAPILDALENGRVLVVEELDRKLHPSLVKAIVGMFNSSTMNKKNAQLIFDSHNTHLLSSGLFRRDQVYFAEKDRYGAAKLLSLAEYKVRGNDAFEEKYLDGRFGGVPYLNPFESREL